MLDSLISNDQTKTELEKVKADIRELAECVMELVNLVGSHDSNLKILEHFRKIFVCYAQGKDPQFYNNLCQKGDL